MTTNLQLEVFGPFAIGFEANGKVKRITAKHGLAFWTDPHVAALKAKQGCYVFALRAAKGFTPWYVGQASKGFQQETFTPHKLNHYNDALFQGRKGSPVLFLVAPKGNKRKVPAKELNHLEKELIQYAITKNKDLCNVQNTNNMPRWTIQGVIRSDRGRRTAQAKQFRTMMKLP